MKPLEIKPILERKDVKELCAQYVVMLRKNYRIPIKSSAKFMGEFSFYLLSLIGDEKK